MYTHTNSFMEAQQQQLAQQRQQPGDDAEEGAGGQRVQPGSGGGVQFFHSRPASGTSPRTLAAVVGSGNGSPRAALGGKTRQGSLLAEPARNSGTGHSYVV